jgi:dolichol-phosphate mannosyltransferase
MHPRVQTTGGAEGTGVRAPDLSVIIPALNEGPNLAVLLPGLRAVLDSLHIDYEILIVTNEADGATRDVARTFGAEVLLQRKRGYGGALLTGFAKARGAYLLTMDADLSHQPTFIPEMWRRREEAEVTIASRYAPGGSARMPAHRYLLSRVLNVFFSRGLSLTVRDMSSGFRLMQADAVRNTPVQALDFDIVQEVLVRAFAEGWKVQEVPMQYAPRAEGSSHARIIPFGMAYLRTFWSLWKLRNSILAADYDDRAYDSPIPLQRYWQRMRFRHVTGLIAGEGPVLDVGCGSSRIIGALPPDSVAADILLRKLRYARKFGKQLVQASAFGLPFPDGSFSCVLCSQVIEHVPKESRILDELCRVVAPGGRLVLGTPDYASRAWVITEKLYGFFAPLAYADEHIAHYGHDELIGLMRQRGLLPEENRYILRGELILAFRKPDTTRDR